MHIYVAIWKFQSLTHLEVSSVLLLLKDVSWSSKKLWINLDPEQLRLSL